MWTRSEDKDTGERGGEVKRRNKKTGEELRGEEKRKTEERETEERK